MPRYRIVLEVVTKREVKESVLIWAVTQFLRRINASRNFQVMGLEGSPLVAHLGPGVRSYYKQVKLDKVSHQRRQRKELALFSKENFNVKS